MTSSWACGPLCCCTVTVPGCGPLGAQDRAIWPAGHSSYRDSPRSRSLAGSDSVTKALSRSCTGRPSQKDFKLGGPCCSGWCTVPARTATLRAGPSGRRAMIQSAVTVPGGGIMIRLTEALARAGRRGRPSQDDFKLGGPRCCSSCTVPGCGHRTRPLGQRSNIPAIQWRDVIA